VLLESCTRNTECIDCAPVYNPQGIRIDGTDCWLLSLGRCVSLWAHLLRGGQLSATLQAERGVSVSAVNPLGKVLTKMDNRLEQAIRTLRAIRQRYESESDAGSARRRSYSLQVALGYADMRWIAAAIEALERAKTTT